MMYLLALTLLLSQTPSRPSSDYEVGPQDKLAVTVFGEAELTKIVTVDSDGTFDFPYIGRVKAGGLTLRAIQAELQRRLGPPNGILVNPQITVEVETFRSQTVHVNGHVARPGMVTLTGNMTLMEALAQAGSPTGDAAPYVLINRTSEDPGTDGQPPPVERVLMADILNGRVQGITLRAGDTIMVPKAEKVYVNGHVRNPGPYVLDSDNVTLQYVLGMAGGVTERGASNRIEIKRTVNGRPVTLTRVKMTVQVLPGDIINVPQKWV